MKIESSDALDKKEQIIPESVQTLLVEQMAHEMYNHNLYLSFASYYNRQGLEILAEYYRRRAAEEKVHHDWIYRFLDDCDIDYSYPAIKAVEVKVNDLVEPFKLTVDQEKLTTDMIYDIVEEAQDQKDWITYQFLMSDDREKGMLIKEQLEEESLSTTVLSIAEMEGSWLRKQKSIMDVYEGDND